MTKQINFHSRTLVEQLMASFVVDVDTNETLLNEKELYFIALNVMQDKEFESE